MNVIDSYASKIALSIKNANPERTVSVEVMTFALIILISGLFSFIIAILIGALTGHAYTTLVGIIAFIMLRFCSGGFHFQSSVHCSVVSIALFIVIPHIPVNFEAFLIITVLTLLLILIYAPSRIESHSNIPKKYYPLLKCIALVLVGMNMVFQLPILTLAFFGQALSLIHFDRREERI